MYMYHGTGEKQKKTTRDERPAESTRQSSESQFLSQNGRWASLQLGRHDPMMRCAIIIIIDRYPEALRAVTT